MLLFIWCLFCFFRCRRSCCFNSILELCATPCKTLQNKCAITNDKYGRRERENVLFLLLFSVCARMNGLYVSWSYGLPAWRIRRAESFTHTHTSSMGPHAEWQKRLQGEIKANSNLSFFFLSYLHKYFHLFYFYLVFFFFSFCWLPPLLYLVRGRCLQSYILLFDARWFKSLNAIALSLSLSMYRIEVYSYGVRSSRPRTVYAENMHFARSTQFVTMNFK